MSDLLKRNWILVGGVVIVILGLGMAFIFHWWPFYVG